MGSAYPPIADYALVGDCHSAALVARDGSVDWFCPGRFDAPAVFCRLLDANRGGYLRLAPRGSFDVARRYRGQTNVLELTYSAHRGRARATHFMPVRPRSGDRDGYDVGTSYQLLQQVEGLQGEVDFVLEFKPTFDYARARTHLEPWPEGGAVSHAGGQSLTLSCPGLHLAADADGRLVGRLRLRAGERRWLALTHAEHRTGTRQRLDPAECDAQLERTLHYWQAWAKQCTYHGPYRQEVLRSALVLKLLTYEPTGAVVAAPTTSLPEEIGGERNWDYRFTWLRDSSLILYALLTIGYGDEAADFTHWLERTVGSDPTRRPQIMYGIDGRTQLPEEVLDHLAGYRDSRPVRVGNAAANQRQLDIFGEVLRAAALHYRRGSDAPHEGQVLPSQTHDDDQSAASTPRHDGQTAQSQPQHAPSAEAWGLVRELVDRAAEHWDESGNGIWEVRGGPRSFLYGKLMCWAALDSGLRLAHDYHLAAPRDRWQRTRDQIRQAILEHGYNTQIGAFTQSFDSSTLDATALVIPRIGFLPPTDHRVRSTVEQIRQHLSQDGLIYRYRTPDGLAGGEGTFTLCTFWLIDALALGGHLDEAHDLFERTLSYTNDLGLLAEEIDPNGHEQLGNFPQGFSHLALIGAAVNLAKAAKHGPEHEAESEGDRAGRASRAAHEGHGRARRHAHEGQSAKAHSS